MSRPKIQEHNCETNEIIVRELTDEEFSQYQKDQEKSEELKASREIFLAKRQALLDKLGITEEEARLLLGGN